MRHLRQKQTDFEQKVTSQETASLFKKQCFCYFQIEMCLGLSEKDWKVWKKRKKNPLLVAHQT